MSKPQTCSICQDPIEVNWMGWADGHNAMPVNDGRCCDRCNDSIVIHARIELAKEFWTDEWPLGKMTDTIKAAVKDGRQEAVRSDG